MVKKGYCYTSTPTMSRTACTEPQCLYKGDFYLTFNFRSVSEFEVKLKWFGF